MITTVTSDKCRVTSKRLILFSLLQLVFTCHLSLVTAVYAGAGKTTANFLRLGVGARAAAMGDAYSAVVDDASAMYWNPAGLESIEHGSLTLMHAAYIENSFFDYAAFGQNVGGYGALGMGIQYLSAGKITETDTSGNAIGSFTPNDMAISLGYAQTMMGYSLGLSGKFIKSEIIDSASALAVDLGILSPGFVNERLRLAATMTNLGSQMKFDSEKEDLPLSFRLGSVLKVSSHWQTGLDVAFPKGNDPYVALGTEYTVPVAQEMAMALRAGFNSKTVGDADGVTGITAGLGFTYQKMSLDYGFVPLGNVGLTHRVSVSLKF